MADLNRLRQAGITQLRRLDVPALAQVVVAIGDVAPDRPVEPPAIEEAIRASIEELGPGRMADAAARLFGLEPGTRHQTPTQCREDAAEVYDRSVSWFRERHQPLIIDEIAEALLRKAHRYRLRRAHLEMERRTPASSRLAVQWLERFEAYYRIWSPISGLGNDLTAYRLTLLDEDRPYDEEPDPEDPQDQGYTQELQAQGYGTFALYHYACFLHALGAFQHRHGGLWLLSDAQADQEVADAVYRISWHSPMNERDDSYLRQVVEEARGELHAFLNTLKQDEIGRDTHQEWQEWLAGCACVWPPEDLPEREPLPTHLQHAGIDRRCQVHAMVAACADYMLLIDHDWQGIADWYSIDTGPNPSISSEKLYSEHVKPLRPSANR